MNSKPITRALVWIALLVPIGYFFYRAVGKGPWQSAGLVLFVAPSYPLMKLIPLLPKSTPNMIVELNVVLCLSLSWLALAYLAERFLIPRFNRKWIGYLSASGIYLVALMIVSVVWALSSRGAA